jgi:hypothetical protein
MITVVAREVVSYKGAVHLTAPVAAQVELECVMTSRLPSRYLRSVCRVKRPHILYAP